MIKTVFHLLFKTKAGLGVCLLFLLMVFVVVAKVYSRQKELAKSVEFKPSDEINPPVTLAVNDYVPQVITPPVVVPTVEVVVVTNTVTIPVPVVSTNLGIQFRSATRNQESFKRRNNLWAPFGQEIRCALKYAAVSGLNSAPVRGIVGEDLYYKGVLLIPRDSFVHGELVGSVAGERLITQTSWRVVWPSGFELVLKAVPTYRFEKGDEPNSSIKEGAAGIWGFRFKTMSNDEWKLFAATFLGAAAQSFQQTRGTPFGNVLRDTPQNASLAGVSAVMKDYADQLHALIQQHGFAVLAPPGTPFWLTIQEDLFVPPKALTENYQQP